MDVTSAVVAEDITLDLTEAVPTGRSYQSYLQLVPGVLPDDPESPGNPASKSGLNYSDIGGGTSVSRNRSRIQGGNNFHLKYHRLFGDVLVEGSYSRHNGEVSDFAVVSGARNSIVFRDTDVRTLEDEQLGGFGLDDMDQRDTQGYKGTAVLQVGRHAIHGGVELMRNANFRDTVYDDGLYVSLSPALSGLTAGGLIAGSFTNTQFDPTNSSDYTGFIRAIDGLPDRAGRANHRGLRPGALRLP